MKTCTKCGETKPLSEFSKDKRTGDGLRTQCKDCINARHRAWLESSPVMRARKRERDTAAYHDPENHELRLAQGRARYADPALRAAQLEAARLKRLSDPEWREKKNAAARAWREIPGNKERHAASGRAYRNRPDRVIFDRARRAEWNKSPIGRAYFADRQRKIRKTDTGKIVDSARKLLYRCLELTGRKKSDRTNASLGYTNDQLRQRMECQFRSGMSWGNHGEWHIDHKKPIAAFLRQGVTDPKIINALCNLQPLWAAENLSKSDKWTAANDNEADFGQTENTQSEGPNHRASRGSQGAL